MPKSLYNYQYETSPRKLEPEYTPKKNPYKKKKTTVKKTTKKIQKKAVKTKIDKNKSKIVLCIAIGFVILLAISYRNTKINEEFSEIQSLKKDLALINKENEQIEVNIENSMNLNNLEQEAKTRLGMQKLNNNQKIYLSLPKKDYIEPATEAVIIEDEEPTIIQVIISNIMNIF